jgi:hypothetical protein
MGMYSEKRSVLSKVLRNSMWKGQTFTFDEMLVCENLARFN